jgi:aldehyde dehydrogenase (NAD+)
MIVTTFGSARPETPFLSRTQTFLTHEPGNAILAAALATLAQIPSMQERVRTYIKKGVEEGATLVTGGPEQPENQPKGFFVKPTVFANVDNKMKIAQEEIFGPVLCIIPYETEEDAIRIANDSVYGLAGGVWSADPERAKRVARRIRTGQININDAQYNPFAPCGGFKQSGRGREYGKWGLEEFLEVKSMQGG